MAYHDVTPSKSVGDRFIPDRGGMNFDLAHHNLLASSPAKENVPPEQRVYPSPARDQYRSSLSGALFERDNSFRPSKILAFRHKPPQASDSYCYQMRTLYSTNKYKGTPYLPSSSTCSFTRKIPKSADRVLDAPGIRADYYLNLLDWSSQNMLAVALDRSLYLWNATSSEIECLFEMEDVQDHITSVSWMADGTVLAVGTNGKEVQLWDVQGGRQIRSMRGHQDRVSCLSWNGAILSSGSRDTFIIHHDVRIAENQVALLHGHQQEVCGLRWSDDCTQLASGANDNVLNVWEEGRTEPRLRLDHHTAAVKALAWCPWQSGLLASGGGSADRSIKVWNTRSGTCLSSTDTGSQVGSLVWSRTHKELVSCHGYSQNQLILWRYPAMTPMAELLGHTERVLFMSLSPDGETVVSAAADERLRFWRVWPAKPGAVKRERRHRSAVPPGQGLDTGRLSYRLFPIR